MHERHVDVYRVGLLEALYFDIRALFLGGRLTGKTWREIKHIARSARRGDWRRVRQSFHGWHAEHEYAATRCGIGWTRQRALADLRRHLDGGR